MNKAKFIELFNDGGYWTRDDKFFHPSFKKGWRKVKFSNISFTGAANHFIRLGSLEMENGKMFIK